MEKSVTLDMKQVLMDGVQEMVFVVAVREDAAFVYDFINRAAFEKTHLDETALGKTFQENHSKRTAEFLEEQYRNVLATGESYVYEDSYTSPAGHQHFSESRLTPLFDEAGSCTHVVGVVKDITEEKLAKVEGKEAREWLEESRSRYRSLFHHNADAIFTLDLQGEIVGSNAAAEDLTGFKLDELMGTDLVGYISPGDADRTWHCFRRSIKEILEDCRINVMHQSGEEIGCLIKFSPIEVHQEIVGVYAILKDMRELDKMISKFGESEKRFRIIAENIHDVIVLMSDTGKYLYVSPSSEEIYGYKNTELMNKPPYHNTHDKDKSLLKENFWNAIESRQPKKMQLRIRHKTKGWIWSEVIWSPVFDEQKHFSYMVTIARDISLQKEYEEQLEYFAYHDSLTGLPNRRFFENRLAERFALLHETGETFALMVLDIDNFKDINDRYGHETGDGIIQEFGSRLREVVGERDIAARLGGDEFIVLLSEVETEELAAASGEKFRQAFKAPWHVNEETLRVTSSMGIAIARPTSSFSSLTRVADQAMYASKKDGRDCYRIASDE
ncbi:bifunctional diguanylate cyclase/phosphodiesterase [Planococcus salinus]|uniref:sensor domain-containing protein n=1 Tax=Planococcus salinus TaxID=1848460 RepID=UPI00131482D3|nr:PAS domain S-box protein [Planococcus salinus]